MKKIIVVVLSVVVSYSILYACGGHCDFNNSKYAEEAKIFDDAMYLYNEIGEENIDFKECYSIACSMNEMEKARAEANIKEMNCKK